MKKILILILIFVPVLGYTKKQNQPAGYIIVLKNAKAAPRVFQNLEEFGTKPDAHALNLIFVHHILDKKMLKKIAAINDVQKIIEDRYADFNAEPTIDCHENKNNSSLQSIASLIGEFNTCTSPFLCKENGRNGRWAQEWINADQMQDEFKTTGANLSTVKVAIVDTGFDQKGAGKLFQKQPIRIVTVAGKAVAKGMTDEVGHGTSVASLYSGPKGIGLAPDVQLSVYGASKLISAKGGLYIDNIGKITNSAYAEGIAKACEAGNQIINASFGEANDELNGKRLEIEFREFLDELAKRGCIVVKAAGNAGNKKHYETDDIEDSLLRVGALARSGMETNFSSRGEIYAPGERVLMLGTENGILVKGKSDYCGQSDGVAANGTSFAAPLQGIVLAYVQAILNTSGNFKKLSGVEQVKLKNRILKGAEIGSGIDGLRAVMLAKRWVVANTSSIPTIIEMQDNLENKPDASCMKVAINPNNSCGDYQKYVSNMRRKMALCRNTEQLKEAIVEALKRNDFSFANWLLSNSKNFSKNDIEEISENFLKQDGKIFPIDLEGAFFFLNASQNKGISIPKEAIDKFKTHFMETWENSNQESIVEMKDIFVPMITSKNFDHELLVNLIKSNINFQEKAYVLNQVIKKEPNILNREELITYVENILSRHKQGDDEVSRIGNIEYYWRDIKKESIQLLAGIENPLPYLETLIAGDKLSSQDDRDATLDTLITTKANTEIEQKKITQLYNKILQKIPYHIDSKGKSPNNIQEAYLDWKRHILNAPFLNDKAKINSDLIEYLYFPGEGNGGKPLGSSEQLIRINFIGHSNQYIASYKHLIQRALESPDINPFVLSKIVERAWPSEQSKYYEYDNSDQNSIFAAQELFDNMMQSPSLKNNKTRMAFLRYIAFDYDLPMPKDKIKPLLEEIINTKSIDDVAKKNAKEWLLRLEKREIEK